VIAFMKKLPDGSFETIRVSVGRDGLTPPDVSRRGRWPLAVGALFVGLSPGAAKSSSKVVQHEIRVLGWLLAELSRGTDYA
jgi:hypothetical protein